MCICYRNMTETKLEQEMKTEQDVVQMSEKIQWKSERERWRREEDTVEMDVHLHNLPFWFEFLFWIFIWHLMLAYFGALALAIYCVPFACHQMLDSGFWLLVSGCSMMIHIHIHILMTCSMTLKLLYSYLCTAGVNVDA